jgi:Tfp pilus assembly protein PilV
MKRISKTGQRGSFLLEVTCAVFIITFGVMGVLQGHMVVWDKTKALQENAIAERALQNEMEYRRAQSFDALQNAEAAAFLSNTPELEKLHAAKAVVIIGDAGVPGLKEVTLRLRWRGEHGRLIEKSLSTLMARKDR